MVAIATIFCENVCYIRHRTVGGSHYPRIKTNTMDDCYRACARLSGCVAITYGVTWPKKKRCYRMKTGYGRRKFTVQYHLATLPCEKLKRQCPSGHYRSYYGKDCYRCSSNTFSRGGSARSCIKCPQGQYSYSGRSSCTNCPRGKYGKGSGKGCGSCPPGTYTNSVGSLSCKYCEPNTYASSYGRSSCTSCPAGTYSGRKARSCTSCPPGKFGRATGAGCSPCPANTYSVTARSTRCTPCKQEYISLPGSSKSQSCTEVLNGAVCWAATKAGRVEDSQTFEDAYLACKGDSKCGAVTCRRNKSETSKDKCSVGNISGKVVSGGLCRFDIS